MRFEGAPRFARRAYLLDVSRCRVPRRDTLHWLVEVLGRLGINELQLYVEHTFAYAGHDVVWRDASPLTVDDLRWLRDRAAEVDIELVANLNCFGHMERWLVHDEYRNRAECPDGHRLFPGSRPSPPTCLAATAENADFAVGLVREMLDAVGGSRVMIGGDEPFELGLGRSQAETERIGRDAVYRSHLARIAAPLVADGIDVMIWGDQFRRDPAAVEDLPDGVVVVPWNYEAPGNGWAASLPESTVEALGLPDGDERGAIAHVEAVASSGRPFWVAAGTGTWTTLIGRNANAAANLADTAAVGAELGADGFLVCDWGDLGHHQPLAVSLPSLVRGAAAAWSGEQLDVGPIVDDLLDAAAGTGALIDELGHLGEGLGASTANSTPLGAAVLPVPFPTSGVVDPDLVAAVAVRLDEVAGTWADRLPTDGRGSIVAQELEAICGIARLAIARLAGKEVSPVDLDAARERQRAAWLKSSRPGGLDESLGYLR
ncbi:MAG: hypothetical protein AAGD18_07970 [Actinomycetota bacterium]